MSKKQLRGNNPLRPRIQRGTSDRKKRGDGNGSFGRGFGYVRIQPVACFERKRKGDDREKRGRGVV